MELRQLQYFLTVAEEESFAKASKKAFISQQALSKSIMSLEQELGTSLFDRGPHGVTLTDAGHVLFRHAYNISYDVTNAKKELLNFQAAEFTRVSLAVGRGIENSIPFFRVMEFENIWPDLRLSTICSDEKRVERMIVDGQTDLGIIGALSSHEQVTYVPIYSSPMFLACNSRNPLAEKSELALSDLKDQPLIGSADFYHFYNRLNTLCNLQGFSPCFRYQTENILYINELIKNNRASFLCPGDDLRHFQSPDICMVPFKETAISFTLYLGYKTGARFPDATQKLYNFILDTFCPASQFHSPGTNNF